MILLALTPALGGISRVSAQELSLKPLRLEQLPSPPREISDLLRSARVSFECGPRIESQGEASGPANAPRTGGDDWQRGSVRIVAETRFQIAYTYRSQPRWELNSSGDTVTIRLRFSNVRLKPTHRVWFEKCPEIDGFWEDRLVLHELDHVRISNDPSLTQRFNRMLREPRSLTRRISPGDSVDGQKVDQMVERFVAEVFSRITDLAAIRYRELDRLTGHGLRPIPADSDLHRFLRTDATAEQPE